MSSDRVATLQVCTMPERAEAIEQLGALLCAVQAELVDVVTASELERDWAVDGATCTPAWLMALLHVSHHTAKEWVRAGAALQELPKIREAFATGPLSWDQVAPATVYAMAGHRRRAGPGPARPHGPPDRRDGPRPPGPHPP